METTSNHIDYSSNGNNISEVLCTYSEEEKQQNEINRENAKHIFNPKFIPVYPELLNILTPTEAIIFGFIDFYKNNSSSRFYFTNEQISQIVKCSECNVSRAISRLEELNIIKTSKKRKASGGQIRFVTEIVEKPTCENVNYQLAKRASSKLRKEQGNKNKINENKINDNNIILHSENDFSQSEINIIINLFKPVNPSYKELFKNKTERSATQRLIKEYGVAEISMIIERLPEIVFQPFAPRITTPYQLEKNLGKLQIFIKQHQGIKKEKKGGMIILDSNS